MLPLKHTVFKVLGQLPPRKIAHNPNPNPNANPNPNPNFPRGQLSGYRI